MSDDSRKFLDPSKYHAGPCKKCMCFGFSPKKKRSQVSTDCIYCTHKAGDHHWLEKTILQTEWNSGASLVQTPIASTSKPTLKSYSQQKNERDAELDRLPTPDPTPLRRVSVRKLGQDPHLTILNSKNTLSSSPLPEISFADELQNFPGDVPTALPSTRSSAKATPLIPSRTNSRASTPRPLDPPEKITLQSFFESFISQSNRTERTIDSLQDVIQSQTIQNDQLITNINRVCLDLASHQQTVQDLREIVEKIADQYWKERDSQRSAEEPDARVRILTPERPRSKSRSRSRVKFFSNSPLGDLVSGERTYTTPPSLKCSRPRSRINLSRDTSRSSSADLILDVDDLDALLRESQRNFSKQPSGFSDTEPRRESAFLATLQKKRLEGSEDSDGGRGGSQSSNEQGYAIEEEEEEEEEGDEGEGEEVEEMVVEEEEVDVDDERIEDEEIGDQEDTSNSEEGEEDEQQNGEESDDMNMDDEQQADEEGTNDENLIVDERGEEEGTMRMNRRGTEGKHQACVETQEKGEGEEDEGNAENHEGEKSGGDDDGEDDDEENEEDEEEVQKVQEDGEIDRSGEDKENEPEQRRPTKKQILPETPKYSYPKVSPELEDQSEWDNTRYLHSGPIAVDLSVIKEESIICQSERRSAYKASPTPNPIPRIIDVAKLKELYPVLWKDQQVATDTDESPPLRIKKKSAIESRSPLAFAESSSLAAQKSTLPSTPAPTTSYSSSSTLLSSPLDIYRGVETKEVETKEVETKEVETKEVETKEVETKEVETKEVETKEVETKEVETKEVETKETETKEIEINEHGAEPDHVSAQEGSRREPEETPEVADSPEALKTSMVQHIDSQGVDDENVENSDIHSSSILPQYEVEDEPMIVDQESYNTQVHIHNPPILPTYLAADESLVVDQELCEKVNIVGNEVLETVHVRLPGSPELNEPKLAESTVTENELNEPVAERSLTEKEAEVTENIKVNEPSNDPELPSSSKPITIVKPDKKKRRRNITPVSGLSSSDTEDRDYSLVRGNRKVMDEWGFVKLGEDETDKFVASSLSLEKKLLVEEEKKEKDMGPPRSRNISPDVISQCSSKAEMSAVSLASNTKKPICIQPEPSVIDLTSSIEWTPVQRVGLGIEVVGTDLVAGQPDFSPGYSLRSRRPLKRSIESDDDDDEEGGIEDSENRSQRSYSEGEGSHQGGRNAIKGNRKPRRPAAKKQRISAE